MNEETLNLHFNYSQKILAATLKDLRLQENLTQEELALELGISRTEVQTLENAHGNPSFTFLVRLYKRLGKKHYILDIMFTP